MKQKREIELTNTTDNYDDITVEKEEEPVITKKLIRERKIYKKENNKKDQ